MKPSGTIYNSPTSRGLINQTHHGEFRVALTLKEIKRFRLIRAIGANLSGFALAFAIFVYGPSFELDLDYQAGLSLANAQSTVGTGLVPDQSSQATTMVAPTDPITEQFAISIPAIGASSRVIPGVDPYNEEEYFNALKVGIAHAAGTGLPGEGKRIYLFAHSTNSPVNFSEYNAIFYQLRLLSEGDRIFVNFNGNSHIYTVTQKVIASSEDTHWLTENSSVEQLVLQTCDPPGTTARRLLVIAE